MTPDREEWLARNDFESLVMNARGVAFAAFGPLRQIAAALGISEFEAESFQCRAQDDFATMLIEAKCRRERGEL